MHKQPEFTIEVIRYAEPLWQFIGSLRGFAKVLITFYVPVADEKKRVQIILTDIRIIEKGGRLFMAMPSRRIMRSCNRCSGKNCIDAEYCNWCSARLPLPTYRLDAKGREVRFADIAYPISQEYRDTLQGMVLSEYERATPTEQLLEN